MELEWSPLQVKYQDSVFTGKIQYLPTSNTLSFYCDNLSRNLFSSSLLGQLRVLLETVLCELFECMILFLNLMDFVSVLLLSFLTIRCESAA
jgi:hypothetical protein